MKANEVAAIFDREWKTSGEVGLVGYHYYDLGNAVAKRLLDRRELSRAERGAYAKANGASPRFVYRRAS